VPYVVRNPSIRPETKALAASGVAPDLRVQRELESRSKANPEFEKRGVTPLLVSVDRQSEASKTQASYSIPFPVLSDPDLAAHRAFRVLQQVDAATAERYKEMGIDLENSSGRKHHTIAVPSIFLIDEKGIVRWAHADRDYKLRPSTEQLLAAIDRVSAD
jgi:peroxiredoxin